MTECGAVHSLTILQRASDLTLVDAGIASIHAEDNDIDTDTGRGADPGGGRRLPRQPRVRRPDMTDMPQRS